RGVTQLDQDAIYIKNSYGGDHLRLPRELLADPAIQAAATVEAEQLLAKMTSCTPTTPLPNVGAMWFGWLKCIKARIQECHRRHTLDTKAILHDYRMRLAVAQRDYQWTRHGAATVHAAQAALDTATAELRQYTRVAYFDFHANAIDAPTVQGCSPPTGGPS
ncbi:hypothetical protein ACHHYP_06705, partial [Achlya hypogyna]